MRNEAGNQFRAVRWLLQAKAAGVRSPHFWVILLLLAAFAYVYYNVLTAYHDIYLVILFYPLIYAALTYRVRGVVVTGVVILAILLPYAMLIAGDAYMLVRVLLFAIFAFLISGLGATLLNYLEQQLKNFEEIMALNRELNSYIEKLEATQRQLIQAEKLNAIGQLAASVAHEINNPMAGILIYTKLLTKKLAGGSLTKEEGMENLGKIKTAANQCSYIIRSLLNFSRQSEPKLETAYLNGVIDDVLTLIGHQAMMKNIEISAGDISALPAVRADTKQLQQVFVNLAVNAIQAMSENGLLTISGSVGEDGMVRVSVGDTGCGIAPEDMENLFTPFYTTKEEVKGVGLGLAVSHGIIERHGGRIEVQSEPGRGSTFTVCLPPLR